VTKSRSKGRPKWAGIDPGKQGCICVYDGERLVAAWPIPYLGSEPDLSRLKTMFRALRFANVRHIVLEEQQVYGSQGAVSAGTIMFGYAALKACCVWSGISFECVKPDVWKRGVGIPKVTKPKNPPKVSKPKRGASKAEKETYKKYVAAKKTAESTRKKKRKELSVRKAQELEPDIDFRMNERAKVPHMGKVEAFLIAVHAHRTTRS